MSVMFLNGQVLFHKGQVAFHERCCCDEGVGICCPCNEFIDNLGVGQGSVSIKVEVVGINTQTKIGQLSDLGGVNCRGWGVTGLGPWNVLAAGVHLLFECIGTDPEDIALVSAEYDLGNANCSLSPPAITSWTCTNNLFSAVIESTIVDVSGCDWAGEILRITVEITP